MTKEIVHVKVNYCHECPFMFHHEDTHDPYESYDCNCPSAIETINPEYHTTDIDPNCPLRSKMFVVYLNDGINPSKSVTRRLTIQLDGRGEKELGSK